MSELDLSFEQLRQDIFESILTSLGSTSYSHINNALSYGRDPEQLILPLREDAMLLGQYGVLSLRYMIPNHFPINFNIALTLGRLNYSIQAHKDTVEQFNLHDALHDLADEVGIKCGSRRVHDEARFEFCNDPTLVWAPSAINILRSPQLEHAFKEFVRLQSEKLILSISGILASHGVVKPQIPGIYAVIMVRSMGRSDIFEEALREDFTIISKDSREPLNILYSVRSKEQTPTPLMLLDSLGERLSSCGYDCAIRPAWGFSEIHPTIAPIIHETVVENRVEIEKRVEVEKIVEVERIVEIDRPLPTLDLASLLTEPSI